MSATPPSGKLTMRRVASGYSTCINSGKLRSQSVDDGGVEGWVVEIADHEWTSRDLDGGATVVDGGAGDDGVVED